MTARAHRSVPDGLHRISAAAQKTGISEHTLRIWERRYGALSSHRTDSGYRLFTDGDIERIGLIKELIDAGYAIGDVAPLPQKDLARLRSAAPRAFPEKRRLELSRSRFLDSIERFDLEQANAIASACAATMTPLQLVTGVFNPILEEVGRRWHLGTLSIAQEHAASALIRGQLATLLGEAKPLPFARTMLATTPADELHELGVLSAALIVASAGERVLFLGANMPTDEIVQAAKDTAEVVLLSVVCLEELTAQARLASLRAALPQQIELWAGGASIRRQPPAGIQWLTTHEALFARVAQSIQSRRGSLGGRGAAR